MDGCSLRSMGVKGSSWIFSTDRRNIFREHRMTSPYMAAIGLPGLEVEQCGLYASLLEEIGRRKLNASHLKLGLVHELSQLVFLKPNGRQASPVQVPRDKLSTSEFCHVVVYMAGRHGVEVAKEKLKQPKNAKIDQKTQYPPI